MTSVTVVISNILIGLREFIKQEHMEEVKMILWMNLCNYTMEEKTTALAEGRDDTVFLANLWLQDLILAGCTEGTIDAYRFALKSFLRFAGKGVREIEEGDIRKYLANGKIIRGWTDATYNTRLRVLRSFFTWGYESDYLKQNPMKRIKEMRTTYRMGYVMSAKQREKYRSCCRTERELAIVDMLYSSGARISELCQINWRDINFQKREVKILGKGKKERCLTFSEQAEVHIRNYLNGRTDDNPALFVGTKKPYKRLTDDGIRYLMKEIQARDESLRGLKITPHTFRRTCGTDMINRGCAAELVKEKLGHRSVSTTLQCYAALSQERLHEAERKYCVA